MRSSAYLLSVLFCLGCLYTAQGVTIEETLYEGRQHFKILTQSAVYYYDRSGGGLSRVLDKENKDWVAFSANPLAEYPASAGAGFRGIPNFVFRSEDSGAGHPGFDQCTSVKVNDRQIRTTSNSGKWQWLWSFEENYAVVEMEKVDPGHAYWFLYEGPIAGSFSPRRQYWGTDKGGPNRQKPDYYHEQKISGKWQWAYFGDKRANRVLLVAQHPNDDLVDLLSYLGNSRRGIRSKNGMMVFGFGRKSPALPLMKKTGNKFFLGFYEKRIKDEDDHLKISQYIKSIINTTP